MKLNDKQHSSATSLRGRRPSVPIECVAGWVPVRSGVWRR